MTLVAPEQKLIPLEPRGFSAVGIYRGKTPVNLGTLLRTAASLGSSFVFGIGTRWPVQKSGVRLERHLPVFHFDNISQAVSCCPENAEVVFVEIGPQARRLETFTHPERALYILGAEDTGIPQEVMDTVPRHHVVQLPGKLCLNVATAGSIVLYDRHVKTARHAKSQETKGH